MTHLYNVSITDETGAQVARIVLQETATDWHAEYGWINANGDTPLVTRLISKQYLSPKANILGVITLALRELWHHASELIREGGLPNGGFSTDMARQERGTMRAIQAGASALRNNRSAFWRRQSKQYGKDSSRKRLREEDF